MRETGLRLNAVIEKYLSLIVPVSLILGFLLSRSFNGSAELVPYLFGYLTFVMATGCSWKQIREAFRMPVPMLLTFGLCHVLAPMIGYLIGTAAFGEGSPYVVGFVMFSVIPLGVSSVIWVGLSKGHVPLTLAMIVIDSALSPLVIPAAIEAFFGTTIAFDHTKVMMDLVQIIVVPTILGVLVNELSKGRFKGWSAPVCGPTSKLAMVIVVMINAAVIQPYVMEMKADMLTVVPLVFLLVAVSYALGFFGSLWLRKTDIIISVTYSSGMRNISLGLVLALAYFEPLTAVPVVLSILIQQPMASVNRWCMKLYGQSRLYKKITGAPQSGPLR
ncbi:bile acid:sodium symporter family protein [Paenibacillus caseinilyticus]|uniref:bile acid:sodium symporter family protein n=1 Tax=Paenibacillus mucilaginosus TaxID=61624 RepID=UPI0019D3CCB7|nr:bile acid:sodium symporter family protein [Paenibacillus mucilaginosus]